MDSLDVTAAIKGPEIEFRGRFGFPETEEINTTACEARDRNVPRNPEEVTRLDQFRGMITAIIRAMFYATI